MGLLSRMYRLGRSTIHEILDETCPAIHKALKADYLTVSDDKPGYIIIEKRKTPIM